MFFRLIVAHIFAINSCVPDLQLKFYYFVDVFTDASAFLPCIEFLYICLKAKEVPRNGITHHKTLWMSTK